MSGTMKVFWVLFVIAIVGITLASGIGALMDFFGV